MLMNCPRCGFSQPQDKYCAQCGVDMQNYRPRTIPFWKKMITHPALQIAFVLGIAGYLSLHFIQRSSYDPGNPRRPYSFLRILSPEISPQKNDDQAKAESAEDEDFNQKNMASSNSDQKLNSGNFAFDGQNPEDLNTNEKAMSNNSSTTNDIKHNPIRISFYEVDRQILTQFFNESQNIGMLTSANDLSIGMLGNIDKKLSPSNARLKLLLQESPQIDNNKEIALSYGNSENELLIRIDSIDTSEANLKGHIEINRSWKDGPEGEQFEISENSGFYVSGFIPRKSGLEQDPQLKQGPFQILSSRKFQNRDSEIVLFIEYLAVH